MDLQQLQEALNSVLQAQSEQELISVLQSHPELLEMETMMAIMALAEQAGQDGETETAEALRIALHNIAVVASNRIEAAQTEQLPKIEPKAAWAIRLRRHIALQKPEILDEAIAEAQGDTEIVNLLDLFKNEDIEKVNQTVERLIPQLQSVGRNEEAATAYLIYLNFRVALAEMYIQFPIEQQRQAREAGIQACQEAAQIAESLDDAALRAFYLVVLAGGFYSSRQLREAEYFYLSALKIQRELAESEPHIFNQYVATTLNNLGAAQSNQRKLKEAERSYAEALEIRRKLAKSEPHIFNQDVAGTLNNLGNAQRGQRKLKEAERSYAEALETYRELAKSEPHIFNQYVATTLNNLGNAQSDQRKLKEAERSYTKALKIRRKLAKSEPHIFNQDVAGTLNNLGYLFLEKDVGRAKKEFADAKNKVEELMREAIGIDDKISVMQGLINVYEGLLACHIKERDWDKTLEMAEFGKSRSLSELLKFKSEELQPKAPTPDTREIVEKLGRQYSDASKNLTVLENERKEKTQRLNQLNEDERQALNEIDARIKTLKAERKRIVKEIQDNYDPDFPPAAAPIKADEIKRIAEEQKRNIVLFRVLRETTALVFVFPDKNLHFEEIPKFGRRELIELYIDKWLIPYLEYEKALHEFSVAKKLCDESSTEKNLKNYRDKYDQYSASDEQWKKTMNDTLTELDKKLIFKVREVLQNKNANPDVLFVPSQSLALLPLHAACREENNEVRYLLEDYNITYCPSVSVFQRCCKNKPETGKDATLGIITPSPDIFGFEKGQIELLNNFNKDFTKLSKEEATIENVVNELTKDYGFVHLYCHGIYGRENPFDSGLEMYDNKLLKLSEILNQDLKENQLTVLSACETGVADAFSPTDEHLSLPVGFIFAGSPSIWGSLWSVRADATSDLMNFAYQNLKEADYKEKKSEALRQAQIIMATTGNYRHPYYWAGFQHFGV
ncbi:MAG: CHAT domain-containing protein [Acidobacteria bacterium]|nr:CHAT domain-containing protein [Acidobacteriota bacterium]